MQDTDLLLCLKERRLTRWIRSRYDSI